MRDDEVAAFLLLLAGCGAIAARALTDDSFPKPISEAAFQREVLEQLRIWPSIGSELDEHPRAAGGITDLSLRKVRVELKVEKASVSVDSATKQHGGQVAQYAAGSDRRCGILVVLDASKKTSAPGLVSDDIGIRLVTPHEDARPVVIGVVVVRGRLPYPSRV